MDAATPFPLSARRQRNGRCRAVRDVSKNARRSRRSLGFLGSAAFAAVAASHAWLTAEDAWLGGPPASVARTLAASGGGLGRQAAVPGCGLTLGLVLHWLGGTGKAVEIASIVMICFGAQTGMNLYMKSVLSQVFVDAEEGLRGIPAGFLLSSIQQFVALLAFCAFLLVSSALGGGYRPKRLTTAREWLAVVCFSFVFALNMGLSNFSLALLPISIKTLIRACIPLSTALSQSLVGLLMGQEGLAIPIHEWALMAAGVSCASLATFAKGASVEVGSGDSRSLAIGVAACVASIFFGAFNMVFAGLLGTQMRLNPLDTTCYMALPAALLLLLPAFLVPHPVDTWPGFDRMTDIEVFRVVLHRNPAIIIPVLVSGLFAFVYNTLQYTLVHKLSASYASFAGNFNGAATVVLSLVLGLESLPAGGHGQVFLLAVAGNIGFFTLYSAMKTK